MHVRNKMSYKTMLVEEISITFIICHIIKTFSYSNLSYKNNNNT